MCRPSRLDLQMLFPSAKGQLGGFACVIMWGATLVPVAAAALSLQVGCHGFVYHVFLVKREQFIPG